LFSSIYLTISFYRRGDLRDHLKTNCMAYRPRQMADDEAYFFRQNRYLLCYSSA